MPILKAWVTMTTWSVGLMNATAAKITPSLDAMYRTKPSDMRTSMNMADGATRRSTARYGSRTLPSWAGRRIDTDIGSGFRRGAIRGSRMNLGVLRRFTTAAG